MYYHLNSKLVLFCVFAALVKSLKFYPGGTRYNQSSLYVKLTNMKTTTLFLVYLSIKAAVSNFMPLYSGLVKILSLPFCMTNQWRSLCPDWYV